jgi:hypothetical protein
MMMSTSKKFSLQVLYPPPPAGIVPSARGRWGWPQGSRSQWISTPAEKISLQDQSPRRARNGTPVKGRRGIELTRWVLEKLSLPHLYPPGGEESFHRQKDDGGGVNDREVNDLDISEEKLSLQHLSPHRARNGTPTKGRWGWVNRSRQWI